MTLFAEAPAWGPTGEVVYERTYRREQPNGEKETWADTVVRVVSGNLGLVYGEPDTWAEDVKQEALDLTKLFYEFKALPAGRHLWASGVPGRQYLFNCHVSGWDDRLATHYDFTFMRLMEGGGVGANYSEKHTGGYLTQRGLKVHVVCDPEHADYPAMKAAGVLSEDYSSDWPGAFEVEDSREGWSAALTDLLDTYTTADEVKHRNRVYDVTNVRPMGARLKTFGGRASGPLPLAVMLHEVSEVCNRRVRLTPLDHMEIDHSIAKCVVSGGNRRSARMAMLHWRSNYVFEFIACKQDPSKHWTTNISVEIDDEFVEALNNPEHRLHQYATDVHFAVVRAFLENGEPGYWNSSLSNEGEPNVVVCTNPCGEIALESWENCNLGHVNLEAFAPTSKEVSPEEAEILGENLLDAHRLMTRFLIRATFGDVNDPKQAAKLARNRRIGVGHFGVQGFLAKIGVRFSEAPASGFGGALRGMYQAVRQEARDYAFELRIPEPVKVTTVAPTGTIAKLKGATEGIHPIYSRYFIRRVRFSQVDPDQRDRIIQFWNDGYKVEADLYAPDTFVVEFPTKERLVQEVEEMGYDPEIVESSDEISFEAMLDFQAMYQENYADNAVSFTVNVIPGAVTVDQAAQALKDRLPYLKGTTIFPDLTRPQSPYERITREEYEAALNKSVADGVDENCSNGACPVK